MARQKKERPEGLLAEACEAYGIDGEFILAAREADGEAVICTNGGAKVKYHSGDKVQPLTRVRVTGIPEKK